MTERSFICPCASTPMSQSWHGRLNCIELPLCWMESRLKHPVNLKRHFVWVELFFEFLGRGYLLIDTQVFQHSHKFIGLTMFVSWVLALHNWDLIATQVRCVQLYANHFENLISMEVSETDVCFLTHVFWLNYSVILLLWHLFCTAKDH